MAGGAEGAGEARHGVTEATGLDEGSELRRHELDLHGRSSCLTALLTARTMIDCAVPAQVDHRGASTLRFTAAPSSATVAP